MKCGKNHFACFKAFRSVSGLAAFVFYLLLASSCKSPTDDRAVQALMDASYQREKDNAQEVNHLHYRVRQAGDKEEDLVLLARLDSLMLNHPFVEDSLTERGVVNYVNHLLQEMEAFDCGSYAQVESEELLEEIESSQLAYATSADSLDFYILQYYVRLLQYDYIQRLAPCLSFPPLIDFGMLKMDSNADTIALQEEFKSIITMSEPLDDKIYDFGEVWVTLTLENEEITSYQVEEVGKHAWILSFTPSRKGSYHLLFGFRTYIKNATTPGFPHIGEKVIYVE